MKESHPEHRSASAPSRRKSTIVGVLASLLLHGAALCAVTSLTVLPPIEFELQLPSEVRFGVTEAPPPPLSPATAAPAQPAEPPAAATEAAPEPVAAPAKEAKTRTRPEPDRKPQPPDRGGEEASDAGAPLLAAYAPEGAQVALRIDLERIRASTLSEDVRSLLAVLPDWQAVLGGSGIEPLSDLDRLYLASPDLRRENLVVAGQYAGGDGMAIRAVASLAAEQGKSAAWRDRDGLLYAPWLNRDETERIVVLLGSGAFVITREMDLPRVVAVARALARRARDEGRETTAEAEALLAMPDGVSVSLSVEGARLFARGDLRGIPSRLEVTVGELDAGQVRAKAVGIYDSPEQAEAARHWWEKRRQRYAGHPVLLLIGLGVPLAEATLECREERVVAESVLSIEQTRMVLGLLTNALAPPQPRAAENRPDPGSSLPAGAKPPTPDSEEAVPPGESRKALESGKPSSLSKQSDPSVTSEDGAGKR